MPSLCPRYPGAGTMLRELAGLYRENLLGSVMPFWMKHSLDRQHGGYFTCLDRDGSVYDTRKYIWLNGRQVWTLSRLYNSVEKRSEWLDAARLGAEFLRRHAFDQQRRCWFSLTREGAPAFFQRKPYSGVFVMLGFHEYWRATGEEWYRDRAFSLYQDVQKWIADPALLGRPPAGCSQLADIYVLTSMALELGDHAMLARCIQDVQRHYDPERRLLRENSGGAAFRATPEGRMICVGSIFEITWFLLRALDLAPDAQAEAMLFDAVAGALEFGWDREHGGFYYFQDIEGKPMLQLEASMKLWWVHVEAIYCLICCYTRTRDPKWLDWLAQVHEWVWARFPDLEASGGHGEWFGYLDRQGNRTHTLKGNNYKGCFHVPRALLFSCQTIEEAGEV